MRRPTESVSSIWQTCWEPGDLYVSQQKETWICTNCGYIYEGEEPPQYCPVCRHDQGYFARRELAPWYLKENNRSK